MALAALLAASSGDNTAATLNFMPKLNREYLESGYRELMRRVGVVLRRERRILEYLITNRTRRVTRAQIFNAVYGVFNADDAKFSLERAMSQSLDAEMRLAPFSYFWICWKVRPRARPRSLWL